MSFNWRNLFALRPASTRVELLAQADAAGSEAQNNLGVLYSSGGAFPQDLPAATLCFRKAAEHGYALAQSNLALVYASGRGLPKNREEAVKWFRRAAHQGDAGAQFHLGRMLHRLSLNSPANATNESRIEGFMWLQLASGQGFFNAQCACDELNLQMTTAELDEGKVRVANFVATPEASPSPN